MRGQYVAGMIDGEPVVGYREEDGVDPRQPDRDLRGPPPARRQLALGRGARSTCAPASGSPPGSPRWHCSSTGARSSPSKALTRDLRPNVLVLRIQPDEGITPPLRGQGPRRGVPAPVGGHGLRLRGGLPRRRGTDGYERLLHDAMIGDADPVHPHRRGRAGLADRDPYLEAWSEPGGGLHFYDAGTWGPHMADLLLERSGNSWRIRSCEAGGRGARPPGPSTTCRASFASLLRAPLPGPAGGPLRAVPLGGVHRGGLLDRAASHAEVDWSLVDLYMGDERCVPADDPDANQRLVREHLVEPVGGVGSFTPMGPTPTPSEARPTTTPSLAGCWPDPAST